MAETSPVRILHGAVLLLAGNDPSKREGETTNSSVYAIHPSWQGMQRSGQTCMLFSPPNRAPALIRGRRRAQVAETQGAKTTMSNGAPVCVVFLTLNFEILLNRYPNHKRRLQPSGLRVWLLACAMRTSANSFVFVLLF